MNEKLIVRVQNVTNQYAGKRLSTEMFDEISKKILETVGDFERQHHLSVVGLKISKNPDGKVAVYWDEVEG